MSTDYHDSIELSVPSELGYETLVGHMAAWLASRLSFPADRVADLRTAINEACMNAIEHGNQGLADQDVHIILTVTPAYLEALVQDCGVKRFEPQRESPASIEQKVKGLAPARGMGLLLIEQLVDECEFVTDSAHSGNCFMKGNRL